MPELIIIIVGFIVLVILVLFWKVRVSPESGIEIFTPSSTPNTFIPTSPEIVLTPENAVFRLTIADTFNIRDRGLVVTGKVENGMITVGQRVQITSPDGAQRYETQVTSLEAFNKTLQSASAGDHVGILLANLTKDQIKPGMIITSAE